MSAKFWSRDNTINPYYFSKDSLEVFINSSFSAEIIFDKFQPETIDRLTLIVKLGKFDQFYQKHKCFT